MSTQDDPAVRRRATRLVGALDPRRRSGQLALAGAVLVLTAIALVWVLGGGGARPVAAQSAPRLPVPAATTSHAPTSAASARARPTAPFRCVAPRTRALGGSAPVRICVPDIHVDAQVMQLGLNADRTVQVPPLSQVRVAGWYKYSAAPGSVGPTVVLGHVNSAQYGDGVFLDLALTHAGDKVVVYRGDGRVATYRIDRVQQVSKSRFPSQAVYGATSGPALRLVTCGGRFDASTGSYNDNIIAYGTLTSLSRR